MSFGIRLRVHGPLACFTRPEMKAERVSYDVITPSAAKGIIEAIYWKPQIRWVVDRIHVLRPIRFTSLRRNEVGSKVTVKGATGALSAMESGSGSLGIFIEEDRQQRAGTILRDVEYVIDAHFDILDHTDSAGSPLSTDQAAAKHLDQFNRRLAAGQCFHQPSLGCREFVCAFEPVDSALPLRSLTAPDESFYGSDAATRDLGFMLHTIDYRPDPDGEIIEGSRGRRVTAVPHFFRALMTRGVINVPPPNHPEVRS